MPKLATTRLNDTLVERAKPKDKPYEIRDAGQEGLVLRVLPSGSKRFYVQLDRSTRRVLGDASLIKVKTAQIKVRDLRSKHDDGKTIKSSRDKLPTLEDYLDNTYKDWIKSRTRHGERDTDYLKARLGKLANIRLDKLSQARIDRWVQDRAIDVKPATLNRELAALKASLNRAVEWGLIDTNPAQRIKRIKDDAGKRVRYLSDDERKALFEALDKRADKDNKVPEKDHLPVMVKLVLNTGMRRGEVFSLCWEDVRLDDNPQLTVHASKAKSGKDRYTPLNKEAVSVLRAWKLKSGHREGLVFRNAGGGRINSIKTAWASLMDDAKIDDFRFHDLRHDFASRLVQSGVSLYEVKDLLGHSTIQLTERYAHLKPEHLRTAVDLLVDKS